MHSRAFYTLAIQQFRRWLDSGRIPDHLFLATLLLSHPCAARGAEQTTNTTETPRPSLTVSLEQSSLRELEPVQTVLWIANDSTRFLTNVQLRIDGPSFLLWRDGGCDGPAISNPLALGNLPAHSLLPARLLCASVGPTNKVGTFNVLFTVQYAWVETNSIYSSLVSTEKAVTIDVLGASSVLGVPLGFASLIVPGLFFWLVLGLFNVPWMKDRGSDEKLALSVLVSVGCLAVAAIIHYLFSGVTWTKYFDFSANVSFVKLGVLGTTGLVLGGISLAVHRYVRYAQRRKEQALQITTEDTPADVLRKILELNPKYKGNAAVVRVDGQSEYLGAHYARTADGVLLAGCFGIDQQEFERASGVSLKDALKDRLDKGGHLLQERQHLVDVLKALAKNGLDYGKYIRVYQPIHELGPNGWTSVADPTSPMLWPVETKLSIAANWTQKWKLLDLV